MTERKPHKWAEVIKAWADGKPIQLKDERVGEWIDYKTEDIPNFSLDYLEWRVKPSNIVIKTKLRCKQLSAKAESCLHCQNIRS